MAAPSPKEARRTRPISQRAEPQNPRRKFKRRTTDSLSDSREFRSDDESHSSMSESLELDDIGSDGEEVDEETGLTGKERQKYLQRRRRQDALDARITGAAGLSVDEKKAADRNVMRKLVVNAILIAAWYVFSLSISLVCSHHCSLQLRT
jgi:solute carrier family 35, member C2